MYDFVMKCLQCHETTGMRKQHGQFTPLMYQSNRSFNIHPQAFKLLKIGLFKFPPLGAKFKCPTN